MQTQLECDFLVIGGGSGGIAAANRAASHGADVILIERNKLGGTCVNVGCVPKKVMWNAANLLEGMQLGESYGIQRSAAAELNFKALVAKREQFIARLNGLYRQGLEKNRVRILNGEARFVSAGVVEVQLADVDAGAHARIKAKHILIATGGKPHIPSDVEGAELGLDSDGFFALDHLKAGARIAIIGGGYIAVELAGVCARFGSPTDLWLRGDRVLRNFDAEVAGHLETCMRADGIRIFKQSAITALKRDGEKIALHTDAALEPSYDRVFWAVGRVPNVEKLGLDAIGLKQDQAGHILVDAQQNTNHPGIYAVGDVTGKFELTPVAIAAGRQLAERLFNRKADAKVRLENVASVVFSHPPLGSVGLSEEQAVETYGRDAVRCYRSTFTNIFYALLEGERPKTLMKLVTLLPEEKVIGLHGVGLSLDEVVQGFAVAMNLGATKRDFDSTIAIHPTAAEEFVTMR